MRARPMTVGHATVATKFTIMAIETVEVAARELEATRARAGLVPKREDFAGREFFGVDVVAFGATLTIPAEVVAVAEFCVEILHALVQAIGRDHVRAREVHVHALVVDVEEEGFAVKLGLGGRYTDDFIVACLGERTGFSHRRPGAGV